MGVQHGLRDRLPLEPRELERPGAPAHERRLETSCQATFQYHGAVAAALRHVVGERARRTATSATASATAAVARDDSREAAPPERRARARPPRPTSAATQPPRLPVSTERDDEDADQRAVERAQPPAGDEPRDRDRKPDRGQPAEPVRVAERLLEERALERVRRIRRPFEQPLPERVRADDADPGEGAREQSEPATTTAARTNGEIDERALRLEQ